MNAFFIRTEVWTSVMQIWGTENPQAVEEVPMKSEKVMVCCAMHKTKIIEPYFFLRSSVDSAPYKSMLQFYGLQHVHQLPGSQSLQQYAAHAHTSDTAKEYLSRKLGNNWISRELLTRQQCLLIWHRLTSSSGFMWKIQHILKEQSLLNILRGEPGKQLVA